MNGLIAGLRGLYLGADARGRWFRYSLLTVDLALIAFFVVTSFADHAPWIIVVDAIAALVIGLDLIARFLIAHNRREFVLRLTTWADVLVLISLIAPLLLENLLFLRVLRAMRIARSYHVARDLRQASPFIARNAEVIESVINLIVFVFVMTALVYVLQVRVNADITNYVDALYFTVTTLTTTGFGDITPQGASGRVLAVVIMVVGVALFLRLVQTIFRPQKVEHECPDCGLSRHDPDAVHCKHCGRVLHIASEGA